MEALRKLSTAIRRDGLLHSIRKALANPIASVQYLFSNSHEVLPKHRVERPPLPSELAAFVSDLGIETTRNEILGYWLELCDDTTFRNEISAAFYSTEAGPEKFYHNWRDVLYVLLRLIQPELVVETGVRGGLSSAYVLNALDKNGFGHLISIDVGDPALLPEDLDDPKIGWIVLARLRDRWELRIADSVAELPTVLNDSTDVFLSDVPNEILRKELSIASTEMRPGSVIVSSYPDGSKAAAVWREFVDASCTSTAMATRWEKDQRQSSLCAGRLKN